MPHNAAKLVWALDHESRVKVHSLFADETLNFKFEFVDFGCGESYAIRTVGQPAVWPIESAGGQIGGEKRYGKQADLLRVRGDCAKGVMVCFLNRAARAHFHVGTQFT